jgi:hypothetical protein
MAGKDVGARLRRRERTALLQLGKDQGNPAARDAGLVICRLDVAGFDRAGLRHDLRRHGVADHESLRR